MTKKKKLLLVGGGHGHLYVLKQCITHKIEDTQVVLISDGPRQYYSGMASAYMEDLYQEEAISVDLKPLCDLGGVTFIQGRVQSFDPIKKFVVTTDGVSHHFDMVSFDTGSTTMTDQMPGAQDFAKKVKPLAELTEVKKMIQSAEKTLLNIVLVGGGASSVELGLAMKKYGTRLGQGLSITLVTGLGGLLQTYPDKLQDYGQQVLSDNGLKVLSGDRVSEITESHVRLASGGQEAYDIVLLATGSGAHDFYKASGVKVNPKGYMLVNRHLQNVDFPYIFGIGDCIAFDAYDYVTKVGVYAVKEGPYLWQNLIRYGQKQPLKTYVPQKKYLSILSTGQKTGVLEYHGLVAHGQWVWRLKNWIDVKFIEQFQSMTTGRIRGQRR